MTEMAQLVDVYKLSPMQEAMFFHSLMNKDSRAYHWQTLLTLRGNIDRDILEKSINRVIKRYDVLRTVFQYEGLKQPMQIVLKERRLKVNYQDISQLNESEQELYLKEFCRDDLERGFDLSKDLLMRISLFKVGPDVFKLVWISHHIIMDGWCLGIIFKNFLEFYEVFIKAGEVKETGWPVPYLPYRPYRRYIDWLERQDKEKGLTYWREYLAGYERQAEIPKKPATGINQYDRKAFTIDAGAAQVELVNGLAAREQIPPAVIWQTLWGVLLQKYNNTTDVVFGLVVTVRPPEIENIEEMAGLFINTVPVRVKSEGRSGFSELVRTFYGQLIKSKEAEYLPLAEIQAQSLLKNHLFDHLVAIQNYPFAENLLRLGGEHETGFRIETSESFDLADYAFNIIIIPTGRGNVTFSFDANLYEEAMIKRLGDHFLYLLQQVAENPEKAVNELEIITPKEKEQLLCEFNQNEDDCSATTTIHGLFATQVEKFPDCMAVFGPGQTRTNVKEEEKKRRREEEKNVGADPRVCPNCLTYHELNKQSNHLAGLLIEKGILPGDIIAIKIERSIEMIIGILGILKAGGAYLPIDPKYPQERIDYMLKDSGAELLAGANELEGEKVRRWEGEKGRPRRGLQHSKLAYVIYTSGSTGKPKGVMVEHGNVLNLVTGLTRRIYANYSGNLNIALVAPFIFDASVKQVFCSLLLGHCLFMVPEAARFDGAKLYEFYGKNAIDISDGTPIHLRLLLESLGSRKPVLYIKHFLIGGEPLSRPIVEKFFAFFEAPLLKISNVYGPTECCVDSATYEISQGGMGFDANLPIGTPLLNQQIFIISNDNHWQPIGIPGELCIAGKNVSRGYLNNPELTAEKFNRSYRSYKTYIFYKTSDLARWLEDGNIEFLGRMDEQVKVRGYRIELAEIEAHLLACPVIEAAAVCVKKEQTTGDSYICAYMVGNKADALEIRQYLAHVLPSYMIPNRFVPLAKLPLNPAGKVDREALPEPGAMIAGEQMGYVAPVGEVEEKLAAIWADVLGLAKNAIGTTDDFFMLGGHSLKIIRVAGRIYKEWGVKITPAKLFEYSSIYQLALYIGNAQQQTFAAIEATEKKEYYPVSLAQQRFYMMQQMAPTSTAYNIPEILELSGNLNEKELEGIFGRLIQCHESLRTSFTWVNDQLVQRVHDKVSFSPGYHDFNPRSNSEQEIQEYTRNFEKPFELDRAPLLRAELIKTFTGKYILLVDMHHIICDGVSHGILSGQFLSLYKGKDLPAMRLQYRDYVRWQNELLIAGRMAEAEKYWLSILADKFSQTPSAPLPTDYPRPEKQSLAGKSFCFRAGKDLVRQIKRLTRQTGSTLYMMLLAVFNILLSRWGGQTDISIGSPMAGRIHPDLENIIGLVMATLVLRNQPLGNKTFKGFLEEVKANTLKAYQYQAYPFEALLERVNYRDHGPFGRNPFFDVGLVVQNIEIVPAKTDEDKNKRTLEIIPYAHENRATSKMDLTLTALEQEDEIVFYLEYCTALFKPATMERLAKHFLNLLAEVVEYPERRIEDFTLQGREGNAGPFRCFIIGESTLAARAAEILMRHGHRVLGIVSDDPQVIAWCKEKNIAGTHFSKHTLKSFLNRPFDYLLSINNGHILAPEILALPKKGAINFHDAPLPRFAGMYATTWALMDRETNYAVTWHEMDDGIDTGPILMQKPVTIDPSETAGSLNMKCYEAALASLETLVFQWEQGGTTPQVQDMTRRTYYPLYKRPFTAGIINFNQPAAMIDAFIRSLNFGDYPNPLTTPKLVIGNEFFTIREVFPAACLLTSPAAPGVLTRIKEGSPRSLFIATADGELEIRRLFTLEGKEINLSTLVSEKNLAPGTLFETLDEDTALRIDGLNRLVCKYEFHWLERLRSLQPLEFPLAMAKTVSQRDRQKPNTLVMSFSLPGEILSLQSSLSPAENMITAFLTWLCRMTNRYGFDVGWHDSSRHHINGLAGLFAFPVPLRVDLNPELSFAECAGSLHEELARVQKWKTFGRDIFQRYPRLLPAEAPGDLEKTTACGVMELNSLDDFAPDFLACPCFYLVVPQYARGGDKCLCLYNSDLLTEENIRQLWHHFTVFLQSVSVDPALPLGRHSLLDAADRDYQLHQLNDTGVEFPYDQMVHLLFEEQVQRTPHHTALISAGGEVENRISYRELNEKANGLARLLIQKGVMAGDVVGIMADRSTEVVEAMLAVLKAGGAYLPIDPSFPQERINYILKDSGSKLLAGANELEGEKVRRWEGEKGCPRRGLHHSKLVYVIYTSGSTGKPKGVAVTHGNLSAYIRAFNHEFKLRETDTVLQQASSSFDTFAEEMYPILLMGGSLAIAGKERVLDIQLLVRFIEKYRVTVISCSPHLLGLLNAGSTHFLRSVHTFISGGDILKWGHINHLIEIANVYNTYGPTETTVCATFFKCNQNEWNRGVHVPIGRPIANYNIYLLDENRELVPVGLTAEICVAGPGVFAGYLNRPELTGEKNKSFFRGSRGVVFSKKTPLVYRTGDLARWLPGGVLEFMGRVDQQVKIRGFRIELAEIENCLVRHHDIQEAVVVDYAAQNGDLYLCAYIVIRKSRLLTPRVLRNYLSSFLPDYMVPSYFVLLEKIPLTTHGKIDRRALPNPQEDGQERSKNAIIQPRSAGEKKLMEIWAETLGINETFIGVNTNFFELGGHSLNAAIMIAKVQQAFQVGLSLSEFFKKPYIEALGKYIAQSGKTIYNAIEIVEKAETYPLSSAQKRLFFLEQLENIGTSYNMSFAFVSEGDMDERRFEESLKFLLRRHESLRTSFRLVDGEPVQEIHTEVDFGITNVFAGVQGAVFSKKAPWSFIRAFDLSQAPLLRVGLVKLAEQRHLVLFDMHHIIGDGTSIGILIKEFSRVYNGEAEQLPGLRIQYKDFAVWQNRLYQSGKIAEQEAYWLEQYKDRVNLPLLNLPTDYPRPEMLSFEGDVYEFSLDDQETALFRDFIKSKGITLYMGLNAVFTLLLHKYTGQEDIILGAGIAGRRHADLLDILGMFVNTLAIRTFPGGYKTCSEYLEEVKEITLRAFENQDLQFEELVDRLNLERDPSRNPLFDVCLVVQNFERPPLDLNGLKVKPYPLQKHTAKFDITLFTFERENAIDFQCEYSTRLFKRETMQRLAGHLKTILREFRGAPDLPDLAIAHMDMVTETEKEELLYRFNDTDVFYDAERTLPELFTAQVEHSADHIAIASQEEMVTYRELDNKAGQLANYLFHGKGVRPNDRVGLLLERSPLLICAIWGILKSGGAYVPLDPGLPMDRLKRIIKDAGPVVLVSQKRFLRMLHHLQWGCPSLHSFLCWDTWDIHAEPETERQELVEPHLWDYVAEKGTDDITAGGWISSYTGEPFSRAEMAEYAENVRKKLKPLLHKDTRVLEIGVSSGITMRCLAPMVGFYCGTDISEVIIRKNRERITRGQEAYGPVTLVCLAAHEIDRLNERDFDLVIINSVIQAFPGHNYLRQVLVKCLDLLKPNGHLFIGDVMDLDQQGELIKGVKAFKQDPVNKGKRYKTKTDFSAELFVAPGYFAGLAADLPVITGIECTPKIYTIANELTRFRYDVLLTVDKANFEKGKPRPRRKFQEDLRTLEMYGANKIVSGVTSRDPAYVIFTSGTTGKPKGVMVEHRGVVNLNLFFKTVLGITERDRVLQFANIVFDASVWEIFSALLNGAALYMITPMIMGDYAALEDYMSGRGITAATFPPPYLVHLRPGRIPGLRVLVSAGSKLAPILWARWREKIRIINAYGPTESTICATAWETKEMALSRYSPVPIGGPIANTRIYILDQMGYLQPVGIPGELCIAGAGVARGYLNNPELTAEKFNMSYRSYKSYILYKTGDLARWLPDGNIEFLGRIDRQIKVRGFRIEPAEIENCLLGHEQVREAVVVARENERGEIYLGAYIVTKVEDWDVGLLRDYLAGYLPDYMVPAFFVRVEGGRIPLTVSGKIDLTGLPVPAKNMPTGKYAAPLDDIEWKLAGIWSDILALEKENISRDAVFFEVGGHSLNAITMIARVHKELGVKIPLAQVFKRQTIAELGLYVKTAPREMFIAVRPAPRREYYPLAPAQKRLYLLQQLLGVGMAYNISTVVTLVGELDEERIRYVFKELIQRHESLRTSFHMVEDEPVQEVHGNVAFEITKITNVFAELFSKSDPPEAFIKSFIRPFDLGQAPLLRVGLTAIAPGKHIMVVDLHHIISDGVSQVILIKEFAALYRGDRLAPLRLQYKDYAWQQQGLGESDLLKQQGEFWLKEFGDEIPALNLYPDFPRPRSQDFRGETLAFSLDPETSRNLIKLAVAGEGATLFMVVLSLYTITLAIFSGQEDIIVGVPVAGRRHTDLEAIVGIFINTLALRNYPNGEKSFRVFLRDVKQRTLKAFENQDYPFEELVEQLSLSGGVHRDTGRHPIFDAAFGFQNEALPPVELPGLEVIPYEYETGISRFDMALVSGEKAGQLQFSIEYSTSLFKSATIERFMGCFRRVIVSVLANPDVKLADIDVLSPEEKELVLVTFNNSMGTGPGSGKTLHELFGEQVDRGPHHTALVFNDEHVTYGRLNEAAERLACILQCKGVGTGLYTIVALLLDRSVGMIVGILGVLKAGGAYLPIEPGTPRKRIAAILKDSSAKLLLTSGDIEKYSFTGLQGLNDVKVFPKCTTVRPQIMDLDAMPMVDRSLVDYGKYHRYIGAAMAKHTIPIVASRGCPYNCAYCHKIWPKKHVIRSAENIFAEVLRCYNLGIRRFVILDDVFNLNMKNGSRFYRLILDHGLKLQLFFPNGLRGDILTPEYIDLMMAAGTVNMMLALESASPRIQELIGKKLVIERFGENLDYIIEKYPQVILEVDLMIGFPTETEADALMTLNFIKKRRWIHFPNLNILKIYAHTDMERLALANGVSAEAIRESFNKAYHELPDTLPFEKRFVRKYQAELFNDYFLLKERLLAVLPYQMKTLSEDEIVQKYHSYLPAAIMCFNDLLKFCRVSKEELGVNKCLDEQTMAVPDFTGKIKTYAPVKTAKENSGPRLKILLLELSKHFSTSGFILYDVIESPLGLMYLLTYLQHRYGEKIAGKIAHARIDFDDYNGLKSILEEFKPDVIGVRTLTFYKDFCHQTIAQIRQWGYDVPIILGGPYASGDWTTALQDHHINLAVLGEGEMTFAELIGKMLENNGKLPEEDVLEKIAGIAYVPRQNKGSGILAREIIWLDNLQNMPAEARKKQPSTPRDPAYVIYTSGSTGQPKGTLTTHENVLRVVMNPDYIEITPADRVLQLSNYAFDGSVFDIYGALVNGAALVMVNREKLAALDRLCHLITKEKISIFFVTTALFNALVDLKVESLHRVKKVLFGGERVSVEHTRKALAHLGKGKILHMYGPTETTVFATSYPVEEIPKLQGTIPIGKPIAGTAAFIVDKNMRLLPVGVAGELWVGGSGVAKGYLNNPELSRQKFVLPSATRGFFEKPPLDPAKLLFNCHLPIYRTGDLARWLAHGNIEFAGRLDQQVKIRGFRIEPEEITCQLLKHSAVKEAVVMVRGRETKEGDKYLCAYVVMAVDRKVEVQELREFLSQTLPDYMLPVFFVILPGLPVTPNGKIDLKSLPEPWTASEGHNITLRDTIEEKLAEIWSELLGTSKEKIGSNDDFFELGGHSLSAAMLSPRVHKEFKVKMPLVEIFKTPTIKGMAKYIKQSEEVPFAGVEPVEEKEYYAVSSLQERLFILNRLEGIGTAYNLPQALLVEGKLDGQEIENAFNKLIARHESLRTSFIMVAGKAVQRIHDKVDFKLTNVSDPPEAFIKSFIRAFDLSQAPLLRVGLVRIEAEKHLLMVDLHHIIADGTSITLLVKDFAAFYEGRALAPLRIQYRDFSEWQQSPVGQAVIEKKRNWWLENFQGRIPQLNMLTDYPRPLIQSFRGESLYFVFEKEIKEKIGRLMKETGATLYMVLLACLNAFLARYTGDEDIVIGTAAAGREHVDFQNVIGLFINALAMRNYPAGHKTFGQFLEEVKEKTLAAFQNQAFPYGQLLEALHLKKDAARNPLFDVELVVQNMERARLEAKGLKFSSYVYDSQVTQVDLGFYVTETGENINFNLSYCTDLFKRETIERLAGYFKEVVTAILENPGLKLQDIVISHSLERADFNQFEDDDNEFGF